MIIHYTSFANVPKTANLDPHSEQNFGAEVTTVLLTVFWVAGGLSFAAGFFSPETGKDCALTLIFSTSPGDLVASPFLDFLHFVDACLLFCAALPLLRPPKRNDTNVSFVGVCHLHVCICMCRRAYACQTKEKEIFWGMDGEDA